MATSFPSRVLVPLESKTCVLLTWRCRSRQLNRLLHDSVRAVLAAPAGPSFSTVAVSSEAKFASAATAASSTSNATSCASPSAMACAKELPPAAATRARAASAARAEAAVSRLAFDLGPFCTAAISKKHAHRHNRLTRDMRREGNMMQSGLKKWLHHRLCAK